MIRFRLLLLSILLTAAGCQQQAAAAEPTAVPLPTATPTATPLPTPTPDDRSHRTAVNETVAALRGTVTPTPEATPAEPTATPDAAGASLAWAQRQARSLGGLLFVANAGQRPGVSLNVRRGPGLGHAIVGEVASGDYLVGLAFRDPSDAGCPAGWVWVRDMQPEAGGSSLPAAGGWSCLNYLLDVEGLVGTLPASVPG